MADGLSQRSAALYADNCCRSGRGHRMSHAGRCPPAMNGKDTSWRGKRLAGDEDTGIAARAMQIPIKFGTCR